MRFSNREIPGLTMKVKLIKSPIGQKPAARKTLIALGIKKLNQVKELKDDRVHQGMYNRVKHMLEIVE